MTLIKYPKITDVDFFKKINKIFKQYKIKKKKTFTEICFPDKYNLQIQQTLLPSYINPKTPYKNILLFHKIGAGKTCTAIRIAEEWKNKKNIIIVVPASLIGNFRKELRTKCVSDNSYLTINEEKSLKDLHPSSLEYKNIVKKSDDRIDEIYTILSYNKFVEQINNKLNINNSVLIIDEIQNMISENGLFYNSLKKKISKATNNVVVLMTATPMFDKPNELALLLNLLVDKDRQLPIGNEFNKHFLDYSNDIDDVDNFNFKTKNLDEIKNVTKGIVSYYRGAPPYAFPEKIMKIIKCEMSKTQYSAYKTVLMHEKKKYKNKNDVMNLPNNFYIGSRIVSNVVYPNMKINEEGLESFTGTYTNKKLEKYSIKFYKILKKIKSSPGPIFVYSNFKEYGGIKSFQTILDGNGFKNYSDHGEGKNRYAIWSSDEDLKTREHFKDIFNQKANENGSKLKILLGSPAIKEGVSLLRVKQVHIIEPTWNWSKMEQIIGRAVRFCSHKDLSKDERFVKIYIYVATSPDKNELTTDQILLNMALQKKELIDKFEKILKETAFDCELLNMHNYYPNVDDKKDKIICKV
jgi:superfamily II DNA or RNA helicase